ncbi:hypothetical protein FFA01_13120 [Frigoribacterium faeni]|uniref:Uncharacterized protein n=1 Tax=Frigoribacterium faeni TaxID=145483 RepID=A0ABQ0UNE6_9MICO|nr:hypothetical protein GCM10025699_69680 [Microbacterium flavescens]GEK83003.1 hypothetical protein FFA01_13120 [Frigoribacterium faeni]
MQLPGDPRPSQLVLRRQPQLRDPGQPAGLLGGNSAEAPKQETDDYEEHEAQRNPAEYAPTESFHISTIANQSMRAADSPSAARILLTLDSDWHQLAVPHAVTQ